ncbi:CRISPR-associated helicase Cas3' [Kutzneria sp. NPDC052558]|uniref:CRISPR-associated helicase Cas3' n=1 Tax=Kutzneria sp. NPDC052558 TaxID=3364121 RepID=UPI0037C9E04B
MVPPVAAAWAKARGRDLLHPLVCHVLDTAAVAERLWPFMLGPAARNEIEAGLQPLGAVVEWSSVLIGLHDLGKYAPAFQALRADLAASRLGATAEADLRYVQRETGVRRLDTPHGVVTAIELKRLLSSWGALPVVADLLAVAVGGHHGYFPGAQELRQARAALNDHGRSVWEAWREDLVQQVVAARGLPEPSSLPWGEVHLSVASALQLAGLASVSDWIASDVTSFPPVGEVADVARYARESAVLARSAVDRVGFAGWEPPADTGFSTLFPAIGVPRGVQSVVEDVLADRTGPTLLVVEAPTGEGKTKAALQAAAALAKTLGAAGLYVAMPTRATSNQMFDEIAALLADQESTVVPRRNYSGAADIQDVRVVPSGVGEDEMEDGDVAAQDWFVSKRSLLASIGVGTVDQLLKSGIRSGHVFVRLAALGNKIVVIDEVHAYDTYMSGLLDRLLMWLGRTGVSVVMLSATLPAKRRQDLVAAWQSGQMRCLPRELPNPPMVECYPRVTVVGQGTVVVRAADVSEVNRDRTIVLERVSDDEVVDWVLGRVRDGGSVAVVHNLVRRAVWTATELEKRIAALPEDQRPELIMINGQLSSERRRGIEEELRGKFGPGGTRPRAIVVGTQVLEHSLDLDFDAMLSDVAPVDSLIQRAGRLHRHRRGPDRGVPVLGLTGVVEEPGGPRFSQYLHTVYSTWVLLRTWALLRDRAVLALPQQAPALVDAVYGPPAAVPCPAGWEEAWDSAQAVHQSAVEKIEHEARLLHLPMPTAVSQLAELTVRPKDPRRTRRGGRRS